MPNELSPILETARQILTGKKPMHVSEIAAEAVRTNRNLQLSEDDFAKRLSSALSANLRTKAPAFGKVKNKNGSMKKGIYRLRQSRAPTPAQVATPPQVTNGFLGKAGEHAVMSELLFWGFNASLMAVDEGIDVVASKDNRYFHIQVKTASPSASGNYSFSIRAESFETNDSAQTFYIFVMRKKASNDYAVIPSSHLRNQKSLGVIGGANGLSITISSDEKGRVFTMNRKDDISLFINNFGIIK